MYKTWILAVCLCVGVGCLGQQNARVAEYEQSYNTYPFSDPDPNPSLTKIYPYFRFDGYTSKAERKQWKVVSLENDFIRVLILPQIGGKIWTAIEKNTGRPFIYSNGVVKFRDVAMRGPWTSGGIEANFGIIGHTPNCATPVDYKTVENKDGSVSCFIGVLDLLTRTNWRIEINLPKDKAYFTTRAFWYNNTALEEPYYHWMNTGIKTSGNLEFVFPGNHYLGHDGSYDDWPVNKSNGKNISFYEQNNFGGYKSYHVFGTYTNFFGAYWHDDQMGMVRYSLHSDKAGKKIWIWGLSRQGMIWEQLLTDSSGQYAEIQSGRLFNQNAPQSSYTPFKSKGFAPYSSEEWTEYWYPVENTGGISEANNYGALHVIKDKGMLKITFSPVQYGNDVMEVRSGTKVLYQKKISFTPLRVFSDSVAVDNSSEVYTISVGGNKLVYTSKIEENNLSRPLASPANFDWNSAYGLYLLGREEMDQRIYPSAEEHLQASLKKDSLFVPACVELAALYYRNMRYDESLSLLKRALSIDTYDGAANYYYGLVNEELGHVADAKDGYDIASLSAEYRSPAYTRLAVGSVKERDWNKAIQYADKALAYNRLNVAALQAKAIACRNNGDQSEADRVLDSLLQLDPMQHFALFERYLWQNTDEKKNAFVSAIKNEMPQETYLELAINYFKAGCFSESEKVLQLAPQHTMISYWQAYLAYLQGKEYASLLRKAEQSSPAFVFPFRSETATVLKWASENSADWKAKYYLVLIYKDRNRIEESKAMLKDLGDKPDYVPFYIARAQIFGEENKAQYQEDLERAMKLDKNQWRNARLMIQYLLDQNRNQEALALAKNWYNKNKANYIMGMLYAKTLLVNQKYKDADQLLTGLQVIPFEGATEGRALYREAKLMEAISVMKLQHYSEALTYINEARQWPENLGVGKPYEDQTDERLEDWLSYLCYSHQKDESNVQSSYLEKIMQFTPKVDNTVPNFIMANDLVSAWAIEKLKGKQEALAWLDQQLALFPSNEILIWCRKVFEHQAAGNAPADGTVRVLKNIEQGTRNIE